VVYDAAGVEASHRAILLQHEQRRIARPQRRAVSPPALHRAPLSSRRSICALRWGG